MMETHVQQQPAGQPVGIDPKPWGVPAICVALIIPTLLWASGLATSIVQGSPKHLSDAEIITGLILTIILDFVFIGLAVWLALGRHHRRRHDLGLRPFDRDLWWMPLAAAGGAHLAIVIYSVVLHAAGAGAAVPKQDQLDQLFSNPAILPLAGVATVIMAPIAEEIFFRGFIFAGLIRPLGVFGAMLVSGFIFGAFHIQSVDSIGLLLPFTLVGMLFAWLYYRTGSILPNMGAHFLFNLISFVALAATRGST
jgi:membrane protease YdiL (CAAX protease family)